MNYLIVEIKKQRKSKILIISMVFIAMSIFIGTGLFMANKGIMDKENYSILLWGQSAFYYSNLLAPILAGIISSIVLLVDIKKKNFRRLKSSGVNLTKIIVSKIIIMLLYSFIIQILFFLLFIFSSIIADVNIARSELLMFLQWASYGALGLCTIMSISMYIYLLTNSFTGTVGLSVAGSFISFILLFINEGISRYFPYSFIVIGMRSRILINMNFIEIQSFIIINFIVITLFTILSVVKVKRYVA